VFLFIFLPESLAFDSLQETFIAASILFKLPEEFSHLTIRKHGVEIALCFPKDPVQVYIFCLSFGFFLF
jgi:hypothetical protein